MLDLAYGSTGPIVCAPCQRHLRQRGLAAEPGEPAFTAKDIWLFLGIGAGVILFANWVATDTPKRRRTPLRGRVPKGRNPTGGKTVRI